MFLWQILSSSKGNREFKFGDTTYVFSEDDICDIKRCVHLLLHDKWRNVLLMNQ